jgi:ubiquitin C-terminal hydrolase
MIANLELSTRHAYNPYDYCFSFKEDGNNPTNTGEQKDAQEYLTFFMDRIERGLKDTKHKYLMQSIFGGKTVS